MEPGRLVGHGGDESEQGEVGAKASLASGVWTLAFTLTACWTRGFFHGWPRESPHTASPLKSGVKHGLARCGCGRGKEPKRHFTTRSLPRVDLQTLLSCLCAGQLLSPELPLPTGVGLSPAKAFGPGPPGEAACEAE